MQEQDMPSLRTKILHQLYKKKARGPLEAIDTEELTQQMDTIWEELRPEINHLEQKGFIVLQNRQRRTRIFSKVYLTATGVELVENEPAFDALGNLKNLIVIHQRRLQKLQEQRATFGLHTPPQILIEIEDTQKILDELRRRLKAMEEDAETPLPSDDQQL